jgi:UDP-glucuronate decarboxylase
MAYNNFSKNKIIQEDINSITEDLEKFKKNFEDQTILITGATGLIGKYLVFSILALAKKINIECRVIAQGRSREKLEDIFKENIDNNNLIIWENNLKSELNPPQKIDYIIHTASPTASKDFINEPIEVIDSIYASTLNILKLSKLQQIKSCVYLSSMEIYGQINEDIPVKEEDCGKIDLLDSRSSYPQAKRIAELLCAASAKEKDIPVKIARLSMVYGPGMQINDKRVLNYFINQIIIKQPIILQTKGKSKASVLYIRDAIRGIFKLLFSNRNGEAFNLANPSNYYSIFEMANIAAEVGNISVQFEQNKSPKKSQYRKDNFLNLNINKMEELGWHPQVNLHDIFVKTLKYFQEEG